MEQFNPKRNRKCSQRLKTFKYKCLVEDRPTILIRDHMANKKISIYVGEPGTLPQPYQYLIKPSAPLSKKGNIFEIAAQLLNIKDAEQTRLCLGNRILFCEERKFKVKF